MSCNSAMMSKENENPTIEDLLKHLDHIVDLVGIDHVGLGPDLIEPHNMLTADGWLEGLYYEVREFLYLERINDPTGMPLFLSLITEGLIKRGLKDEEAKKVLGGNWIRVYRQVIG